MVSAQKMLTAIVIITEMLLSLFLLELFYGYIISGKNSYPIKIFIFLNMLRIKREEKHIKGLLV